MRCLLQEINDPVKKFKTAIPKYGKIDDIIVHHSLYGTIFVDVFGKNHTRQYILGWREYKEDSQ